jgi:hypothetical protein
MTALVTATGMATYFGRTAQLVQEAGARSHFQRAVLKIGNFLILSTLALVVLIILVALFRHAPFLQTVQFALILTVAAIPVALPAVLSVTMAIGAEKLALRACGLGLLPGLAPCGERRRAHGSALHRDARIAARAAPCPRRGDGAKVPDDGVPMNLLKTGKRVWFTYSADALHAAIR